MNILGTDSGIMKKMSEIFSDSGTFGIRSASIFIRAFDFKLKSNARIIKSVLENVVHFS